MTDNDHMTWGYILKVLDVLERHGYHRSDNQHTGQAIGLILDAAHVYSGAKDATRSAYVAVPPSPPTTTPAPGRTGQDWVILTGIDVSTVFAALEIAAGHKRDRAADCAGQTCLTCQSRLRDAQAYGRLARQIFHAAEASAAAAQQPGPDRAQPSSGQPQAAADPKAGQ